MSIQLDYNGSLVTLSEEQSTALELIYSLFEGSVDTALIQGSPGTGKTFVTCLAIKEWVKNNGDFLLRDMAIAAPSHKAKNVMQGYLQENGIELDCYTVHSILGKGADIDENEGKQKFRNKTGNYPIDNYSVVWVDEFSMIGKDLANDLFARANRILFTGDIRQLPPINETGFPVWNGVHELDCSDNIVWLTEPKRYNGAIKDLVYDCIPAIDSKLIVYPELIADIGEEIQVTKRWFDIWKLTDFENDDSIILTYTNSHVDKLNGICREYIFGKPNLPLQVGERIIAYNPINTIDGETLMNNGSIATIANIEPTRLDLGEATFEASLYYFENALRPCLRVNDSDFDNWQKYLRNLAKKCKAGKARWGLYYATLGKSANFKPCHALTIHKSQGSGWNNVFVLNTFGWLKDPEVQPRLHYVASSRAKQRLVYSKSING